MRIIALSIKDFCRIEALEAEFTDDGGLIAVASANNAQGKSSTLNALSWALGGPEAIPAGQDVVRDGATKTQVVVKFDDWTLTRSQTKGGRARLSVKGNDLAGTQAGLDKLWSRHTFDAGAFGDMTEKQQRDYLLKACGLDSELEEIERKRKETYDERTFVNREVKQIKARLDAIPEPDPFDPDEEISTVDVLNKIGLARERADWRRECERARADAELDVANIRGRIFELEELLRDARAAEVELLAAEVKATAACDALCPPDDMEALAAELANVEETNRKIRQAREWREVHDQYATKLTHAKIADDQLATFDRQKKALFENVELPVPDLAIEDERLTLHGRPLTVASDAERILLGAQIAIALKPEIRAIRIQHGALLAPETRAAVDSWARKNKCLVFCELLRDEPSDTPNEIWIEEGKRVTFDKWIREQ